MVNPHVSSLEWQDKTGHKRNERPCVLQHEAMHTLTQQCEHPTEPGAKLASKVCLHNHMLPNVSADYGL